MKVIRKNLFETNSSSTHSICISKEPVTNYPNEIWFGIGEFGWGCDKVDKYDYLYTAILTRENRDELIEKLKSTLDKYNIRYNLSKPKFWECDGYEYLDNGYIDHSDELAEFIDAVMSDEDRLLRYLFSDNTYVYTGNDNCGCEDKQCMASFPEWTDENYCLVPNPTWDTEKYEYYYKGN